MFFLEFVNTFLISNTSQSFGYANNALRSNAATVVVIKCGKNNLADAKYFTKRSDAYPGLGIILFLPLCAVLILVSAPNFNCVPSLY